MLSRSVSEGSFPPTNSLGDTPPGSFRGHYGTSSYNTETRRCTTDPPYFSRGTGQPCNNKDCLLCTTNNSRGLLCPSRKSCNHSKRMSRFVRRKCNPRLASHGLWVASSRSTSARSVALWNSKAQTSLDRGGSIQHATIAQFLALFSFGFPLSLLFVLQLALHLFPEVLHCFSFFSHSDPI